jgi:hypothetical protein
MITRLTFATNSWNDLDFSQACNIGPDRYLQGTYRFHRSRIWYKSVKPGLSAKARGSRTGMDLHA